MSFSTKLLKTLAPDSSFLSGKGTLYDTLSRLPSDGVGARVRQRRWDLVGRTNTYWEVTRVTLKNEGKNGKAWGRFVYRGKQITAKEDGELIPGGLKYKWREVTPADAVARST